MNPMNTSFSLLLSSFALSSIYAEHTQLNLFILLIFGFWPANAAISVISILVLKNLSLTFAAVSTTYTYKDFGNLVSNNKHLATSKTRFPRSLKSPILLRGIRRTHLLLYLLLISSDLNWSLVKSPPLSHFSLFIVPYCAAFAKNFSIAQTASFSLSENIPSTFQSNHLL